MRYLAYFVDDDIESEVPTSLTDEQAIELDTTLKELGIIEENEEVAIVEDVE